MFANNKRARQRTNSTIIINFQLYVQVFVILSSCCFLFTSCFPTSNLDSQLFTNNNDNTNNNNNNNNIVFYCNTGTPSTTCTINSVQLLNSTSSSPATSYTFQGTGKLVLAMGTRLYCSSPKCPIALVFPNIYIQNGATVEGGLVQIYASSTLMLERATISANGLGHPANSGPGAGTYFSTTGGTGAGYGGTGSGYCLNKRHLGGVAYGNQYIARDFGSGGGTSASASSSFSSSSLPSSSMAASDSSSAGGGIIILSTASLVMGSTTISANGATGQGYSSSSGSTVVVGGGGGGSGGSIVITVTGSSLVENYGNVISAQGGNGGKGASNTIVGGSGAGGRVLLNLSNNVFAINSKTRVIVSGGQVLCNDAEYSTGESGSVARQCPHGYVPNKYVYIYNFCCLKQKQLLTTIMFNLFFK